MATQSALPFNKIAVSMVKRGVPVIPVEAKGKKPLPYAWQTKASKKPNDILYWVAAYGNDINCGCVATLDGQWMLDADNPELWDTIERETGHTLPRTFTTVSSKGQHKYWLQTPASRTMGNRKAHTAPYEFDAQVDRRQVIAPGSTHPSGFIYAVADDCEIVEAPDWLVEWVTVHGEKEKVACPKGCATVHEDFDFEDAMEHFDISGDWDGNWFITDVCPISGRKHEQSVRTGFFYDGKVFGFHCFAGGCNGSNMSVGQVIAFLNAIQIEEGDEPYRGAIWSAADDGKSIDPKWNIECVDDERKDNITVADAVEFKLNDNCNVTDADPFYDDIDQLIKEQKRDGELPLVPEDYLPVPAQVAITAPETHTGLDFPGQYALYGRLGQIANDCPVKLPLGWLYPSILSVASTLDIEDRDNFVRKNMYVALLGDVGTGKSYCMTAARKSIFVPGEGTIVEDAPGSHSGLMNQLSETEPVNRLLFIDELKSVLNACAIMGSNLPNMLCKLWGNDSDGGSVKKGRQLIYGKLSILGGLACKDGSDFAKLFGATTVFGMADRFLLGYYPGYVKARPTRGLVPAHFDLKPVAIPDWVWDAKDEWIGDDAVRRRLSEHALRVALVTAACNGDAEVTAPCLEAAFRFTEWQQRLRGTFKPGLAETKESECYEAVYTALKERRDYQKQHKVHHKGADLITGIEKDSLWMLLHFRDTVNNKSYYRKYSGLIDRVKKSMVDNGIIEVFEEEVEVESNDNSKSKTKRSKTPFVKLKTTIL